MITQSIRSACVVTAIVAIAACARMEPQPAMAAMPAAVLSACDNAYEPGIELGSQGPGAEQDMRQVVAGASTANILKDEAKLDAAINAMGGQGPDRIAKIESIKNSTFANGLAGVSVRSFLDAAMNTLTGAQFSPVSDFNTKGKVEAYFYDASGAKESCLRVLMTTMTRHGSSPWQTVAYRWHVFGDFQVAPKLHPGDAGYNPIEVFPDSDTVPIPEAMATGFEHKLWARGSGLRVTKVERSMSGGAFVTFPATHPIYTTSAGSCIDMMFALPPPRTLPSGAAPPFYCLGRCKSPPIINTK